MLFDYNDYMMADINAQGDKIQASVILLRAVPNRERDGHDS